MDRRLGRTALLAWGLIAIFAVAGAEAQPRPSPTPEDVGAFVGGIVEAELARSDVAGAVVAVVANGEPVLVQGYGYADVERRVPVDAHTLFRAASISKLFTSLAVMQLVEAGRLELDADVNAYLDFVIPAAREGPVTLRQLLTHRAGFDERLRDLGQPSAPPRPLAEFLRSHLPRRGHTPDGSPSYSNYGIALAGYVVERASGMPFERYVTERIFAPLGMERATFAQPLPEPLAPQMSRGYSVASAQPGPFEFINDAPAGALSASADAMLRFLLMLLGGGALDGVRVISPDGFARWTEPQVRVAGNALGLAIYEAHLHGVRSIGHGGDLSYFHSELHAMPEHAFGVFVAQNSLGKSDRLLPAVLVPALVRRYLAAPRREQPPAFARTPPESLTGSFMTTRRSDRSWLRLQGLLLQTELRARESGELELSGIRDAAGNPERWREVAPGRFRSADGEREIELVRDATGRVVELEPWFPGLTYERAGLLDTQRFALAVFAPSAALALGALLAPLTGRVARRALGAPPAPPRARLPRALTLATGSLWLAGLGGFVTFALDASRNLWRFSRGNDGPLLAATAGIWLAAGLSVACAAAVARELRAPAPSRARRAARALPALAYLALSWFAWHWGLLSDPTRY
jgi:CubicO group peptidase (beta-lactamase class C family)